MYTRNYYADGAGELSIPDNYDGTALRESAVEEKTEETVNESPPSYTEEDTYSEPMPRAEEASVFLHGKTRDDGGILGWFKKLPIRFPLLGSDAFKNIVSDCTAEDILIIGIALFLIFSGAHDIECAVMILLLLFIR